MVCPHADKSSLVVHENHRHSVVAGRLLEANSEADVSSSRKMLRATLGSGGYVKRLDHLLIGMEACCDSRVCEQVKVMNFGSVAE